MASMCSFRPARPARPARVLRPPRDGMGKDELLLELLWLPLCGKGMRDCLTLAPTGANRRQSIPNTTLSSQSPASPSQLASLVVDLLGLPSSPMMLKPDPNSLLVWPKGVTLLYCVCTKGHPSTSSAAISHHDVFPLRSAPGRCGHCNLCSRDCRLLPGARKSC